MKKTVTCTVCPNGCEIEVNYTIGQPIEEGINYDDFQETRTTYGDYEK